MGPASLPGTGAAIRPSAYRNEKTGIKCFAMVMTGGDHDAGLFPVERLADSENPRKEPWVADSGEHSVRRSHQWDSDPQSLFQRRRNEAGAFHTLSLTAFSRGRALFPGKRAAVHRRPVLLYSIIAGRWRPLSRSSATRIRPPSSWCPTPPRSWGIVSEISPTGGGFAKSPPVFGWAGSCCIALPVSHAPCQGSFFS